MIDACDDCNREAELNVVTSHNGTEGHVCGSCLLDYTSEGYRFLNLFKDADLGLSISLIYGEERLLGATLNNKWLHGDIETADRVVIEAALADYFSTIVVYGVDGVRA